MVNHYTFAPELASPLYDAPEAVENGTHVPQRASSHESPELDRKGWRLEVGYNALVLCALTDRQQQSPAPTDPSTFSKPDSKPADGNFAPQTIGAQLTKEAAPAEDSAKKGFLRDRGILFWVGVGLVVLVVIVIGLGVGVGVGLKNRRATSHE